jgi:serine/threonine protein kinase
MRPTLVRTAKLSAGSCFDENTALDLVGGHLSETRKEAALAHAESCESCRKLLADLAALENAEDVATAADTAIAAPSQVGPWEIGERAGQGAGGTVYRACNRQTGHVAAIKLVTDPGLRVRFEREARALASLNHPGIVRYFEHGTLEDGTMYLVMQWLEGTDLAHRIDAPFTAREVLDLGTRLAAALAHAHAHGCVHRDLSPKNVFLPGGRIEHAMILDFGLVRWVRPDASQTASQSIVGTPYYMAPEQIRGVYDIDARADLFALGVLLYQAAAGRLPFEGNDLLTVWQRIVHAQHPDLGRQAPHVPRALIDLIGHLLEKAPSDRPASADVVLQRLESIRRGEIDIPRRSRRTWFAFAGLGLAGTAAAVFASMQPARYSSRPNAPLGRAPAAPVEAAPEAGPTDNPISCVSGTKTERHRHYSPDSSQPPEMNPAAVTVAGTCNLTLEDCAVEGFESIRVMHGGTLTLRRCHVDGHVTFVGGGTLILEASELALEPEHVGPGAKLIRR